MIKVLLVLPENNVSAQLTASLRGHEIDCVLATNYRQAMRSLENDYLIDVVVMAAGQTSCCNRELLQSIRENARYRYIPIILACNGCPAEIVMEAFRRGVNDVVSLPCPSEQIARRIETAAVKGKRRILVVDDEAVIREYLSDVLLMERFLPIMVSSGAEALEVLEKTEVHAVISDILMPGMSGMDLLVHIKATHENLPVILITGYGGRFSPQDALAAGADGYFQKPFKNVDLIRTLRGVLHSRTQGHKTPVDSPRS